MMLFYSETKKIKYFLPPPPPQKKAHGYERPHYGYTHMCFLYQQPVTWFFTRSRFSDLAQSDPFIKNYYLTFISASMIFFTQKKAHLVSTQGLLTLALWLYKTYTLLSRRQNTLINIL